MVKQRFFITGTDTEVGKTFVTVSLLKALAEQGLQTLALKPVAAGCEEQDGEWVNEDALQLMAAMTLELPYPQVNPVALQEAIAPHLAAQHENRRLSVDLLAGRIRGALMQKADVALVEGAGGWLVPLNDRETLADLVRELQMPVILVVGVRLGCLNHAMLTAQAVLNAGLPLAGWVANCVDPEASCIEENIATLKQRMPAPCLGTVPWLDSRSDQNGSRFLDTSPLMPS